MNKEKKAMRLVAILLAAIVVLVFLPTGAFAAPYKDIEGHWAQEQINDWLERGLAGGYPDETFRPDHPVSRAEFATFANRAFGIRGEGEGVGFTDVPRDAWYFTQVAAAQKAGYISGYPDGTFRPDSPISRQEAAVIVARLLGLAGAGVVDKFADHQEISPWAKDAVEAVFAAGLMGGYPDGTFRPQNFITRAETVVTLQKAQNLHGAQVVFDQPGVYGPEEGRETIAGDVVVNSPGVTLQNITITGDLLLAEGIGQGDVTLRGVTVRGETIVKGGGANSIKIEDSTLARLTVAKDGVRILASGSTRVSVTTLESGAVLVSVVQDDAEGFGTVAVSEKIPAGAKIILEGDFATVNVKGAVSEIEIAAGNVNELNIEAPVKVTGKGTITFANIETDGAELEKQPNKLNIAEGVSVTVGGKKVDSDKDTQPVRGGGGGDTRKSLSDISVIGDAQVGKTLTAEIEPEEATANYQWMRSDSKDGTYTNISGATDDIYELGAADAGKWIKVKATGTGSYKGTVESEPVGPVEEKPEEPEPEEQDSIERDPGNTGGELKYTIEGNIITFTSGQIKWYPADEGLGRTAGNRVGVQINAPAGFDTAGVTVKIGEQTYNWDEIKDGDNFFWWYPLVTQAGQEFTATVVWNESSTQEFKVVIGEGVTLEEEPDTTAPKLVSVTPESGSIELAAGETFKLEIVASDDNLYELEVDHSFEGILPEFSVYASQSDPYGGKEDDFEDQGVTVTYNAEEQKWTIDFGKDVTDRIVEKGNITFYLVLIDKNGNKWGSMDPTTPENTFTYTVTQKVQGSIERDPGNTGGELKYTIEGNTVTFTSGQIKWYPVDEGLGRTAGNRVGVQINAPAGFDTAGVTVNIGEQTYNWDEIKDGDNFFWWYPLVTEAGQEFTATVVWNESSLQEFKVVIGENVTLEEEPVEVQQAELVAKNLYGIHDNKIYAGYELQDKDGVQVPLFESNIKSITVLEPNATEPKTLTVEGEADPYLWFNIAKEAGSYAYIIETKEGVTYKATLVWEEPAEAVVSFQAPTDAEAVFTAATEDTPAQVDFSKVTADKLLNWTSEKEDYYAIELKIKDIDLSEDNVKYAFRVYEDGTATAPKIKGDLDCQYVTTDWKTGTTIMYYVVGDDYSLYKAVIDVVNLTPKTEGPAVKPTTGVKPSTEQPISGEVTFTFGFKSMTGNLEELELDIYLGDNTGENRSYANHLGINLPAGSEAVAQWVEGVVSGYNNLDPKFHSLLAAVGYDADAGIEVNESALKSNIFYQAEEDGAGTWTIQLDTAALGEEAIEFLVAVRDDAGAQWGNNNYTAYPDDVKAFLYNVTLPEAAAITMTAGEPTIEEGKVTLAVTTKNTGADYTNARYGIKVQAADVEGDTIIVSYGEGLIFNLNRVENSNDFIGYFGPAEGFTIKTGWDVTTTFTVDFGPSTNVRIVKVDAWVGQAPEPKQDEAEVKMDQVIVTIPASAEDEYHTYKFNIANKAEEYVVGEGLETPTDTDFAGMIPVKMRIEVSEVKDKAYDGNVRVLPVNAENLQLWAKDTKGDWYDINVVGWGPAGGFPIDTTLETDVYIIATAAFDGNVTLKLQDITGKYGAEDGIIISQEVPIKAVEKAVALIPANGEATVVQGADLEKREIELSSNYNAEGLKTFISLVKDDTPVNFDTIFAEFNLTTKVGDSEADGPYNMVGDYSSFQYGPAEGFAVAAGVPQVTTITGKVGSDAPVGTYTITIEVKDSDKVLATASYTLTVIAPSSPSTYKFNYQIPTDVVAGEEVEVDVTFATDRKGDFGYNKVRFKFSATGPEGAKVTFKATDTNNVEHTFVNEGHWGPAEGFVLPAEYEATTKWILTFDKVGGYTITFKLINLEDSETVIAEGWETITVTQAAVEDTKQTLSVTGPGEEAPLKDEEKAV